MYAETPALSVSQSKNITSMVPLSETFTVSPFLSHKWEEPKAQSNSEHKLTTVKSFEISVVPVVKHQPDFLTYVSKIRSAPASLSFSKLKSRVKGSRERRNSDFQAFIPLLGTHPNNCDTPSQYNQMHTRRSSISSSNNSTYSRDLDFSSQSSETSSISPPRSASIVEETEEEDEDELGFSIIKLQLYAQRIGRQRSRGSVSSSSPDDCEARQKPQVLSPLEAELSISFDAPFAKNSNQTPIEPVSTIDTPSHNLIKQAVQPISLQALSDFASIEEQCDGDDDDEVDEADDDDDHSSFYTLSGDQSDEDDEEFYAPQWPN